MHIDFVYCEKECNHLQCKHNKKHLNNLVIDGKKVVTAINWSSLRFDKCNKGVFTNEKEKEI